VTFEALLRSGVLLDVCEFLRIIDRTWKSVDGAWRNVDGAVRCNDGVIRNIEEC
jgi:hypothetical protein